MSRNAPVPPTFEDDVEEPATAGISVGSLLRREGRAPHAVDRPVQPRPHQQATDPDDAQRAGRHAMVRRGAIAAGALLAVGSVFGAAILTDVVPTGNDVPAGGNGSTEDEGSYPGQGLLDQQDPAATPPTVTIDQAATADPLDAGTAAPTNWVPVAFPAALAGASGTEAPDSAAGSGGDASGTGGEDSAATASDGSGETGRTTSDGASSDDGKAADTKSASTSDSSGGDDERRSEDTSRSSSNSDDSGDEGDDDSGLGGTVADTVNGLTGALGLSSSDDGDDKKRSSDDSSNDDGSNDDGDDEGDEDSRSFSLFSAGDEDSSAPQEDDTKSSGDNDDRSDDSGDSSDDKSDSSDDDSDGDKGDDGDDGDDGGLVDTVGDTVSGLLG
ncbi:hypothetical protein [Pseudonocardia sp. MH-G8]|uniref:hypothetical protein n=1 Tax=Pseudonocardia sp. MH-G8 TaxID=1854588 RepID=UPI00117AAE78|nr:hypothetical protein [Pseudonocardia sp. MH-G8]